MLKPGQALAVNEDDFSFPKFFLFDIICGIAGDMIVVDANVVLRAFRSKRGASYAVLAGMLSGGFSERIPK
jgi:hypothetical protein